MNAEQYTGELKNLIKALCNLPAPSRKEEKRAVFCRDYFCKAGFEAYCDEEKNAIAPWNLTESNDIIVFMAHTDTVFPDEEPLPYREENGKMYCPGIGDDTANLAILLLAAKILKESASTPKCGVLFVANAAEEGLGNLRGSKAIATRFKDRIKEWISFDLGNDEMFVRAVGSARSRITVTAKGGHSFEDFGNDSAIDRISRIVQDLYAQSLPQIEGAKTTFNVGTILGGTSVNTIAQQAEMLYEYRSDTSEGLSFMEDQLQQILHRHREKGTVLTQTTVGTRPGMGICQDPERQKDLFRRTEESIATVTGRIPKKRSGSTDCNVPFSLGIPAVCFGLITMGGAHTREEWIAQDSLPTGLEIALNLMNASLF